MPSPDTSATAPPRWWTVLAALVVVLLAAPPTAVAAPVAAPLPADPPTVTADALPTWQIDGVVWSQAVVGDTVYAVGSFSKARPPGVAPGGPGEVDARNIFAFDIRTGEPVGFDHTLDAQALVVRASPDGTRLYVGGDFTTADGAPRAHLAVFDTATGALVEDFKASTDGQVRALEVVGDTLYVGGEFRNANATARLRLASFSTATGTLTSWSPRAEGGYVGTMVVSPDGSRLVVGGSFTTLNGTSAYGMGALDARTGATRSWAANQRIRTGGVNGAITSLKSDGSQIYGAGYSFGLDAAFEGTFAADPTTGAIRWVNDCLGDTYDVLPVEKVVYTVSHSHDCSAINGFPETFPRSRWIKAGAFRTYPTGVIEKKDAYGWDFRGLAYSGLLHWYPDLEFGTYTNSRQAAWSVSGNADYVVLGGEFPEVNGVDQQGLVRFVRRPAAPHARGPVYNAGFTPTPSSTESGKVRVVFTSVWDRDDTTITYDLYRSPGTRIATITRQDSEFWHLPNLEVADVGLEPGTSVRYQVRAKDGDGNVQWSAWSDPVTVSDQPLAAYAAAVMQSGAAHLWRLDEPGGSRVLDAVGDLHGAVSGFTLGSQGVDSSGTAATATAAEAGITTADATAVGPGLSLEAWVRTTSSRGGRVVGLSDRATGTSAGAGTSVLYLTSGGQAAFAVKSKRYSAVSSVAAVNDGEWHHLVGTLDADGMSLFVDGVRAGRNQDLTKVGPTTGFWRIGADKVEGLPAAPADAALVGSVDEVAVYPKALAQADVQSHYTVTGRSPRWTAPATDAYGLAVLRTRPDLFWRFDEAAGPVLDRSASGVDATVSGGVVFGQAGAISGRSAATFDGLDGLAVAGQTTTAPRSYSIEAWFKTKTKKGGELIGFGDGAAGLSATSDRYVALQKDGRLSFGSDPVARRSVVTKSAYNNGKWHHVVATQDPSKVSLWVDGNLVKTTKTKVGASYVGRWRVGGDRNWAKSSGSYFSGTADEVAVYPHVLSKSEVRAHYKASGRRVR